MRFRFGLWEDKLLLLSMITFFYAYSSPVRVAIRAILEGQDFAWGYVSGIRPDGAAAMAWGKGLLGHTDYILFLAFAILLILSAGLRRPDFFFRAALAGWTSIGFGVGAWLSINLGGSLTSNKETLGLNSLSFFWTEVFPAGVAWALAMALLLRGLAERASDTSSIRWTRLNGRLLIGAATLFVLSGMLLNIGPQNGAADFSGIGLSYVALILFLLGLAPWRPQAEPGHPAVVKLK